MTIADVDREQNDRIAWCERLLYALILLQFPQLATML
jgi:hypothetical protein|tara:strand:+ start:257 stop:367 length:111 start_codon:yes stop_codon:yes gene_type:complete